MVITPPEIHNNDNYQIQYEIEAEHFWHPDVANTTDRIAQYHVVTLANGAIGDPLWVGEFGEDKHGLYSLTRQL